MEANNTVNLEEVKHKRELREAKEMVNAVHLIGEDRGNQVDLLIDFIEQNGLDEKLIDHMKDIENQEEIPMYRSAAKAFNDYYVHDIFVMNEYDQNKEMLEEGSDFLLEPNKPLLKVDNPIDYGELPIVIADRMNGY
ncbi:hypothetical protein [Radiobacillus sp. PE A8.2]|uniref:hypothetical protein n=1 Tax=Radiobacillus sp. PE A8.2 TaxID=3380349 RepID=UPI00388D27DB